MSGNSRLHKASHNGDTKAVKLLLKLKVDVNAITKSNRTALLLAVKKGHIKIVKALLETRANLNIQEKQGYTPLHLAIQKGYFDIAQLLIEKGADLNIKYNGGDTAIDIFVRKACRKESLQGNHKKFCRFLVLYLKERQSKDKVFYILFTLALSITVLGLPFIFRPVMRYIKKVKHTKKQKLRLKTCFIFK